MLTPAIRATCASPYKQCLVVLPRAGYVVICALGYSRVGSGALCSPRRRSTFCAGWPAACGSSARCPGRWCGIGRVRCTPVAGAPRWSWPGSAGTCAAAGRFSTPGTARRHPVAGQAARCASLKRGQFSTGTKGSISDRPSHRVRACSRSTAQQAATTAVGLELGSHDDLDGMTGFDRRCDRRPARDRAGDPRCCSRWGCNSGRERKPAYKQ